MVLNYGTDVRGGPSPKFSIYHIWKAYDIIIRNGPIGRKALSVKLAIGEGSTRTILDKMSKDGSIRNTRKGTLITERGRFLFKDVPLQVSEIPSTPLTVSTCNCAVLIPKMSDRIILGCEQRDIAVRSGAAGATTLVCVGDKLRFPESREDSREDRMGNLRKYFDYQTGDVIIIGSATTFEMAEKGAVTAALTLLRKSNDDCSKRAIHGDTNADQLSGFALAVHELMGRVPVGMRSRNNLGVRVESGTVIDCSYTGPMAEESLRKGTTIRKTPTSGPFVGLPMIAVPILDGDEPVATIVVVDISMPGVFELMRRMGARA